MKLNKKKGFTIVELVIVIAVIGVLTAILVPVFINLTTKANEASDQSLVKNLNTVLAMKEQEGKYEGVGNPSDMFALLEDEGYNGEVLIKKQKSGKKIIYNLAKNRFLFEENKAGDDKAEDLWEFKDNVTFDTTNGYSIYLNEEYDTVGAVTAIAGLDVGKNEEITKINYNRHDATSGRNTVIRTNGGDLVIDAPKDTVKHYEKANVVDIQAVDGNNSYHEYGTTATAKIANGRFVITEKAELGEIRAVATNDAFNEIKVAVVGEATLPAITRDPLSIDDTTVEGTHNQLVLEVQTLNNQGQPKQDSQFVWVSVTVDGGVKTAKNEVASSKEVLNDQTKIPVEQQTPAAAEIKNDTITITKVSNFAELKAAIAANKQYISFTNDITAESIGSLDGLVNINYSCAIDGDGHSYTGYGKRNNGSALASFTINSSNDGMTQSAGFIDVTFKNLTINNSATKGRPIETRGMLNSLTLSNCTITATGSGNNQLVTLGGSQEHRIQLNILDGTVLNGTRASYPVISFNPFDATVSDSRFNGYCAFYLKSDTYGANNSVINAKNSYFDCPNGFPVTGQNSFGAFVMENVSYNTITLDSCKVNNAEKNTSIQALFVKSGSAYGSTLIIKGNSSINGRLGLNLKNNLVPATKNYKVIIESGKFTIDPLSADALYTSDNVVELAEGKNVYNVDGFTWEVK